AGGGNGSAVGGGGEGGQEGGREERRAQLGGDPPRRRRRSGRPAAGHERGPRVRRARAGRDQRPGRPPARADAAARPHAPPAAPRRRVHREHRGRRFGLGAAEVQKVADELARLDPKPGLQHSSANESYIIPDLVVEKIDGQYKVFLNDSGLPRLRISKTYQDIARDKKKFQGENK